MTSLAKLERYKARDVAEMVSNEAMQALGELLRDGI